MATEILATRHWASRRLAIWVISVIGAFGGLIAVALFSITIGMQVGHSQQLQELNRLCETMPDVAYENQSMCVHIRTTLD